MSNELAVLDLALPDYLKKIELDDTTKALMGGSSQSGKRISIKGGVWRMLANGKEIAKNEDRALNIIIAAAAPHVSRTYYEGTYQEGEDNKAPPSCWSENGDTPSKEVVAPQASRCVDCAMNQKGSGQGESRACRFSQRLAVLLGNDIQGEVYQLVLPAKSVFGEGEPGKWPLNEYAKQVGSRGIPVTALVTEARFDTDSAVPKLTFKPVRPLSEVEHAQVIEQSKTKEAQDAIAQPVYKQDGIKAIPAPVEETPKAEVKPEPKPEPVVEKVSGFTATAAEEIPEPVKVTAKQEEPSEKSDLIQLLAEWDDD